MAALNFPNSPSLNDTHTENGVTFKWNGAAWDRLGDIGAQGSAGAAGAQGAVGAAGAQGATGPVAGSSSQVVFKDGSNNPAGSSSFTFDGTNLTIGGNVSIGGTLTYEDVTNIDSVGVVTARDIIFSGSTGTPGQFVLRRDSDGANIGQFRSDAGTNDISIGNGGSGSLILKTGANTERLRITSAGDMGLGTASPRSITNFGSFAINGTAGSFTDYFLNGTRTGTTAVDSNGFTSEAVGSSTPFRVITNGAERLRIDSSGRILIGRTSTANGHTLQIQASSGANAVSVVGRSVDDQSEITFYENDNSTILGQIQHLRTHSTYRHRSGYLRFDSGGYNEKMRLDASGNLSLGTSTSIQKFTIDSGGISLDNGWNTQWGVNASRAYIQGEDANGNNRLILGTNNTERLRIDSAGNMGLGVTPIAPGNTALHIGETTSGDPVRLHMTTANTGATASDGFTLSIDGSSSVVNLIQRENAALQIYTDNTSRVSVDNSGMTVNNGYRISTNATGSTSLPNPYSLGNVSSATIPSYPHFCGTWIVTGSVPCNNTWYDLLHSINDSNGLFHGYSGDAASKNIFQYQYSFTSPAYGVNNLSERFKNGAWNTGSISFQVRNNSGAWTLQIRATSYYNSSNNAGFRLMFHSYY